MGNSSWARQYARNGARLMDEKLGDDWVKQDPDFEHDLYTSQILVDVRVLANSHDDIDPYNNDPLNDQCAAVYGFEAGKNATTAQLIQAWSDLIRGRLNDLPDEDDEPNTDNMWEEEGSITAYILQVDDEVVLSTRVESEVNTWIEAYQAIGVDYNLLEVEV